MKPVQTALCRALDLDHPIVQAPIGSNPALAAAVAEAGGLGMLSITWSDPAVSRERIREAQARTYRSFAVNIVLDPDSKPTPPEESLEVALDEGVEVVSFSFGDADPYVERVHDAGGSVMQTVGSAAEAKAASDAAVDVVVAQGWEAGGHVQSEVATLPLVPRVVDVAGDRPVVAAGGIADGRGIAAVLALGAAGAWLGTRFVVTEEAAKHPQYQERVLAASETATEFTELFDVGWPGAPHRVVRNAAFERWENAGRPPADERPGFGETIGKTPDGQPIHRYDYRSPAAETKGEVEEMALYAGQSAGLIDERPSAATVIDRLADEAADAISNLSALSGAA